MQAIVGLFVAISLSQAVPAATTGRIAGRVTVEGTQMPIMGARIMLFPAGRPTGPVGMPPQTTTDQNGRFVFDMLAPGEYRLDVQKTGFAALGGPETRPSTIHVAAGQSVDGVSVQLQRGGVIAGKVLDPSGEPLSDVRITAMRRINAMAVAAGPRLMLAPMQGPQQTNDLGEFRISGLAPGEYYVAAMPSGASVFNGRGTAAWSTGNARTTITTTFYPGTTDQTAAQPVVVSAGAEVGSIVFTMQSAPAYRVSGIVVDEDGKPVARAMVMLMGDPRSGMFMGPAGRAQTQDDGRFAMGDVPPGSYHITAGVPITVSNSGVGGGIGATSYTSVSGSIIGAMERPTEIVVADADVRGVRLVVRRPPQ
jgi:protocatechuate 3,4-dioxygenase beta subunit